jgi:uncharacterized protein YjbI with pentapeptide repeats
MTQENINTSQQNDVTIATEIPTLPKSHYKRFQQLGIADKTVWDWAQFLISLLSAIIIPATLFYLGANLTQQQQQIANDQRNETILQSYISDMTTLLVDDQITSTLPERTTPPLSADEQVTANKIIEARTVAQAKTLTALDDLDPRRKTILMVFLLQANVFTPHTFPDRQPWPEQDIITLVNVDLNNASLNFADLDYIDFLNAHLSGTHLSDAELSNADLRGAHLNGAHLFGANLSNANLSSADLRNANLRDAHLSGTYLFYANLTNTDLTGAILDNANLTNTNITQQQLDTTKSHKGAKLPPGLH